MPVLPWRQGADVRRGDLDRGLRHRSGRHRPLDQPAQEARRSARARPARHTRRACARPSMSPGPHTTLGMPRAANSPASVPNATLRGRAAAGELAAQPLERRVAGAAERRIADQLAPRDRRRPDGARASRAAARASAKPCTSASSAAASWPGRVRNSNSKRQASGTMLSAVPPSIDAGGDRAMGRLEAVGERPAGAELEIAPAQMDDDLGGDLDRVDAQMVERRMAGEAGHAARVAGLALVAVGDPHRRSARRPRSRTAAPAAPAPDGRAGAARPCSRPPRRSSARGGPAPAAGARATPAPAPARPRRSPSCRRRRGRTGGRRARRRRTGRSTSPGRRPAPRRCGRTARGRRARAARSWRADWPCAPVSSKTSVRGDAQPVEMVAHEIDQREVGVAAGGVEPDQPRQQLGNGQTAGTRHRILIAGRLRRPDRHDYRRAARAVMPQTVAVERPARQMRWSGAPRRTILSLAGATVGLAGGPAAGPCRGSIRAMIRRPSARTRLAAPGCVLVLRRPGALLAWRRRRGRAQTPGPIRWRAWSRSARRSRATRAPPTRSAPSAKAAAW